MPSAGCSVAAINAEVQKISQAAGIPGVASSLCDPEIIGTRSFPNAIDDSGQVALNAGIGVWTQLIAATSGESRWILFSARGLASTVDLGTGAPAAEVAFISFVFSPGGAHEPQILMNCPFLLAAGTRLAARSSIGAGTTVRLHVFYGA